MKITNAIKYVFIILVILVGSYAWDYDTFKALLSWFLGGIIMLLLNVAFFGDLINKLMKNKEIQEFMSLFREGKDYLKKLLDKQRKDQE